MASETCTDVASRTGRIAVLLEAWPERATWPTRAALPRLGSSVPVTHGRANRSTRAPPSTQRSALRERAPELAVCRAGTRCCSQGAA